MSYFLSDTNGYLKDFCAGAAMDRFFVWANRQTPVVKQFAREGGTSAPLILLQALAITPVPTDRIVNALRADLIDACKQASGVLAIMDGAQAPDDRGGSIFMNHDGRSPEDRILKGNGSNQYKQKGAVDKGDQNNTGKAMDKLAKLPVLSQGDPNFKAVPFEQGTDKNVAALEKKEMGTYETVNGYNPATAAPLATQDYIEADKVADIIKMATSDGRDPQDKGGHIHETGNVKIANFRGRDYIVDGHHRLTAALLTGQVTRVHYYKVK